jgi:hypothetical protein
MMLNKIKSILAISSLVIGLSISGPAVAGGNSISNAPSTPTPAAVVAAIASTGFATPTAAAVAAAIASTGFAATAVSNPDGTFTITVSGVTSTVSSASIAAYLSVYD